MLWAFSIDEQAHASRRGLVREEALQQTAPVSLVVLFEREAELAQDLQQEFPRTDLLASDGGDHDALVEIAEQSADQQALAATVICSDHAHARAGPDGVAHELQRTQVLVAREEEGVVAGIAKRLCRQIEPGGIGHGSSAVFGHAVHIN